MRSPRGRKEKWIGAWRGTKTVATATHTVVEGTQFIWDPTKHPNATAAYLEVALSFAVVGAAKAELYDLTNSAVITGSIAVSSGYSGTGRADNVRSTNDVLGGTPVNILANLPTSAATIVARIWNTGGGSTTLYKSALVIEER